MGVGGPNNLKGFGNRFPPHIQRVTSQTDHCLRRNQEPNRRAFGNWAISWSLSPQLSYPIAEPSRLSIRSAVQRTS